MSESKCNAMPYEIQVGVSTRSDVYATASSLLSRVRLQGHNFDAVHVSAACAFAALRIHHRDVTLRSLVARIHLRSDPASLAGINSVLTHLRVDLGVDMPGRRDADDGDGLADLAMAALSGAEFWTADGSQVDNASMRRRAVQLVVLARRLPTSQLSSVTQETVAAAAFLRYKAERLGHRARMSVAQFSKECNLSAYLDRGRISKCATVLVRLIKRLVAALPYVEEEEAKAMKTPAVLGYLDDIFRHEELVVAEAQGVERCLETSLAENGYVSKKEVKEEVIDDSEIEGYIRSPQEVEALQAWHDKILGKD